MVTNSGEETRFKYRQTLLACLHCTPHTAAIISCIYDYEVRTRQHASNVNVKSRMYDDMLHNIMLKWKIWIWNQENCFGRTLAICLSTIMSLKLTVHKASYEQMLLQHFLAHQFCWLEYPWVWYNRHFNGISTCPAGPLSAAVLSMLNGAPA